MEESGAFHIDSKGICLVCLKDCSIYDYYGGATKVKQEIGSCSRSISIKMLLRYLKIDLFKLCNFPPSFLESMDIVEDADVLISLCGECFILTKNLSSTYERLEEIRLQMDIDLKAFYEVMKNGESQTDRVEEYERRRRSKNMLEIMSANVADQLRRETMKKCSLKVDTLIPKVTLFKKDVPAMKRFLVPALPVTFPKPTPSPSSNIETHQKVRGKPGPKSKLEKELKANENFHLQQLLNKPTSLTEVDENAKLVGILHKRGRGRPPKAMKKTAPRHATVPSDEGYGEHETPEEIVMNLEPVIISSYSQSLQENNNDPLSTSNASIPRQFPCGECERVFPNAAVLRKHTIFIHQSKRKSPVKMPFVGKKRRLRCKICKKMLSSQKYLIIHMKTHGIGVDEEEKVGNDGSPPVKLSRDGTRRGQVTQSTGTINCSYCGKWFKSKSVFANHTASMHTLQMYNKYLPDGTTNEELNVAIQLAFGEHIRYPNDPTKKHYGCPYCDQRHPHPSHLRLHIIRGHFDKISSKVVENQCGNNGLPQFNYERVDGAGYEIEYENGEEDDGEEFQIEYSNGDEFGGDDAHAIPIANHFDTSIEEVEGVSDNGQEDNDEPPPILMRESYSLSGNEMEQHQERIEVA